MAALVLAPSLVTPAAVPLRTELLDLLGRGEPLLLDGAAVERVGSACLQLLAAARRAAAEAGLAFAIASPSAALREAAALAGLGAALGLDR